MNVDKSMLTALASLDDRALATAINALAAGGGLGRVDADKIPLDMLRSIMRSATDSDIAALNKLINGYIK